MRFTPTCAAVAARKKKITSGLLLATAALCIGDASKWIRLEASKVQRRPRDCTSAGIIFITAADAEAFFCICRSRRWGMHHAPLMRPAGCILSKSMLWWVYASRKRNATRMYWLGSRLAIFTPCHWVLFIFTETSLFIIIGNEIIFSNNVNAFASAFIQV